MTNSYKIIALIIFSLFFIINILTINDGHNWGDDFAQYIHHSINFVEHKPYASDIAIDPWVIYPPGFPLILSSLIYWFGLNFKILKILNVFLWAVCALVSYDLVLNWVNVFWARLMVVWFLSSPFFFFYKQNVLSDIPFMCFVLLSLWTFMKHEEYQAKASNDLSRVFLILSIICMSYSLLIRWAGWSLTLAAILYFIVIKRDWKKSLGFILGALIACLISLQCGSSVADYFDKTNPTIQAWFWASWNNVCYVFQIILEFFISDKVSFAKLILPASDPLLNFFFGLVLLVFTGLFIYSVIKRRISLMGCFTFLYLIGIICWPIPGGTRYVIPIVIPMTIYIIKSLKAAFESATIFIFIALIIFNVYIIAVNFRLNDDEIFQKDSIEMMHWVDDNIKPGEFYMFSKPRALSLLTQRPGATFWVHPQDRMCWFRRIKPLHIKYLIGFKQRDQFARYDHIVFRDGQENLNLIKVWENAQFKIFIVR